MQGSEEINYERRSILCQKAARRKARMKDLDAELPAESSFGYLSCHGVNSFFRSKTNLCRGHHPYCAMQYARR